jgi:hypothetical protein
MYPPKLLSMVQQPIDSPAGVTTNRKEYIGTLQNLLTCTAAVVVLNVVMKLSRLPHLALIASSSSPLQGAASCTHHQTRHDEQKFVGHKDCMQDPANNHVCQHIPGKGAAAQALSCAGRVYISWRTGKAFITWLQLLQWPCSMLAAQLNVHCPRPCQRPWKKEVEEGAPGNLKGPTQRVCHCTTGTGQLPLVCQLEVQCSTQPSYLLRCQVGPEDVVVDVACRTQTRNHRRYADV